MALKKKTTKKAAVAARAMPAAKASKPVAHAHEGDCCSTDSCGSCCGGWGTATRLWWAVTWRTFAFVSLPVMIVQLGIASLVNPSVPAGMLSFAMMMLVSAPRMLMGAAQTVEFWFFLAVTIYSLIGAIYVYAHLIRKGKFGGIELCVEKDCK